MAAGIIQYEGSKYGPCAEPCQHRDCAQSRAMAACKCNICDAPIGYETRFYTVTMQPLVMEHADCAEDKAEKERKQRSA